VRNNLLAFILLFIGLFSSCSEERPDYTIVQTGNITRIDEKNIIYTARILNKADQIEEYGFTWSLLDPERTYKLSFPGEPEDDYFESTISSGMRADKHYNLQSYVKTSQGTAYGRILTFMSYGSETPEALGFKPNTVSFGDTISIWGKNLGYSKQDANAWCISTSLSSGSPLSIIKLTNDTILVRVSNHLTFPEAYLNVSILDTPIRLPGILYIEE